MKTPAIVLFMSAVTVGACSSQDLTRIGDTDPLEELMAAREASFSLEAPMNLALEPGMYLVMEDDVTEPIVFDHEGNVLDGLPAVSADGARQRKVRYTRAVHGTDYDTFGGCMSGSSNSCLLPWSKTSPWRLSGNGLGWGTGMEDAFFGVGDAITYAREETDFHNYFDPNDTGTLDRWEFHVYSDAAQFVQFNPNMVAPSPGSRGARYYTLDCDWYDTLNGTNYCLASHSLIALFADNIRASADACTNGTTRREVFERVALHEIGHALGLRHMSTSNTAMQSGNYCAKPASFDTGTLIALSEFDGSGSQVEELAAWW